MSTARLLVEERKQMLHKTGRALRDQPSLIAVVGESSMVESSRIWSGRQDGIKPQHNRAAQHCRQPASATSKSLHSLSAYLVCTLQHPNFDFKKKEAFEASTFCFGLPVISRLASLFQLPQAQARICKSHDVVWDDVYESRYKYNQIAIWKAVRRSLSKVFAPSRLGS